MTSRRRRRRRYSIARDLAVLAVCIATILWPARGMVALMAIGMWKLAGG
jgi:hypothetical protein